MMMYMMTGAPKIGVTALSGIIPISPGMMQIKLQSKAMALPVSMVRGISELWLEVPSISRAICGTASPMKEMGPQNAVVMAVKIPTAMSNKLRVSLMLMPKFSAYRLPNSKALRGLMSNMESSSPAKMVIEKSGSWSDETALKLPIPQII